MRPPPDSGTISVTSVGDKVFSTGYGYQTHVIYAQNDGRYWLFYVDDTAGFIQARASADLATWTSPTLLAIGGATLADGYSFSVSYANLGGSDVVHIVADTLPTAGGFLAVDIRAVIAGGMITAALPVTLPNTIAGGGCNVDGPQVVVTPAGHVYDVSAWVPHPSTGCDTNIFVSTNADPGGSSFVPTYLQEGYYVSVPDLTVAHDLVSLPDAGLVLALWADNDMSAATSFYSIGWDLSSSFLDAGVDANAGTFPDAGAELFAGAGGQASYDEWTACRLTDGNVHLVRHVTMSPATTPDIFQEQVYNGASWSQGGVPPMVSSGSNTGVVLVSGANPANGMLLASIASDNSIQLAKWTSSSGWSALPPIAGSAQRQSLAGTGCGSARAALFWTEGTSPYTLMVADVTALLGP
jgi:hypothetical protein